MLPPIDSQMPLIFLRRGETYVPNRLLSPPLLNGETWFSFLSLLRVGSSKIWPSMLVPEIFSPPIWQWDRFFPQGMSRFALEFL